MDYTTLLSQIPSTTTEESQPLVSLYETLQERAFCPTRSRQTLLGGVNPLLGHSREVGRIEKLKWSHRMASSPRVALTERIGLRKPRLPCYMTYCNVLAQVDGVQLDHILSAFFLRWEAASVGVERKPSRLLTPQATPIIRIWGSVRTQTPSWQEGRIFGMLISAF